MNAPNPLNSHRAIFDDSGLPYAVIDRGQVLTNSIKLAYEMAANCHNFDDLDAVSERWREMVGAVAFGYVAADALRILAHGVLHPTLAGLESAVPGLGKSQRESFSKIALRNHAEQAEESGQ